MIPKIGEYWYLDTIERTIDMWTGKIFSTPRIVLGKCIGCDIFRVNSELISKRQYVIISKWEPNWFWKLLGYK